MSRAALTALLASTAIVAAGCGGSGSGSASTKSQQPHKTTTADAVGTVQLEAAVRRALRGNSRLSLYTLWHNSIPAWATQSTRGPALAELRSTAAQRRRQGIHIKHLSGRLAIVSVHLDPSYLAATAVVSAHDRVRPYSEGHPLGRAITSNERARVELRRLGRKPIFVVWRLTLLP